MWISGRWRLAFFTVVFACAVRAEEPFTWGQCEAKIESILESENKHLNSSINHYFITDRDRHRITKLNGNVAIFDPARDVTPSRGQYVALTLEGCQELCNDPIAWYDTPMSIALVSSWIFPLNILLSLPYESLHEGKFHRTIIAVLNWLGSPQTALTATVFNFRQFRQAHRRVFRDINTHRYHLRCAAYFILCSLNQFHIDHLTLNGRDERPSPMMDTLIYGLFRPLANNPAPDVEITDQLLVQLAFQLRMLRRRGVIPMLANLAMFLVAFVFSIVLAFKDLGGDEDDGEDGRGNSTATPFSLAFGLLLTWLPLLVVFTIVDRNPVSSERTSELISRWLFNVKAVKEWAARTNDIADEDSEDQEVARLPECAEIEWWNTATEIPEELQVEGFIGQGRRIQYCGLPHAVLAATETADFTTASPQRLEGYAADVAERLQGGKPMAWFVVASLSLLLVWTAILSAFTVSFMAPTVGLGCRALMYLIFGFFSSISWFIQFRKRPHLWVVRLSYLANALAVLSLLVVIIFQVTGLASNCWCKSSPFAPGWGGYIDFKDYSFYKRNFDVQRYWIGSAIIGSFVPTVAFVVALFWWLKCRHLWKANERRREVQLWGHHASTEWLQ
ncbi:hypothetical protein B0T16DRAFT_391758 [Cercophora newfieldiana]|uniref:Uncharacterized protein n=1 Tax=Cercophora newfieldiana TaxID=92897 RepID=A0AA40CLC8_9PEZI|nr:hypothetical protein B0T16DRAFT_391758 [Cercophora newfieldiana]